LKHGAKERRTNEHDCGALPVTDEVASELASALAIWMSKGDRASLRLRLLGVLMKLA
jgi:hypothetical protein